MSTLVHQFMVGLIREEKDREPKAFEGKITLGGDFAAEVGEPETKKSRQTIPVLAAAGTNDFKTKKK